MKIFKDIKNSFYNPSFYNEKKNESVKSSVLYFFKLTSIQSLIMTILIAIIIVPVTMLVISKDSVDKMIGAFPEELTLTVKNGQLSTNVTEPYAIPIKSLASGADNPKEENSVIKKDTRKNFIVIDTQTPFSMEVFENSDTLVLLTKDFLVSEDSRGKFTIEKVSKIPDIEINKAKITGWVYTAIPYLKFAIPLILVLSFFVILVGNIIGSLVFILIASFVIWCVMKIKKSKFVSFKQIYKLGFYSITPLVILDLILSLFGLNIPWYASLVVFLVVFFFNVKEEREIVVSNPQV
jgi:maltodextrin utilization protein YvdJ